MSSSRLYCKSLTRLMNSNWERELRRKERGETNGPEVNDTLHVILSIAFSRGVAAETDLLRREGHSGRLSALAEHRQWRTDHAGGCVGVGKRRVPGWTRRRALKCSGLFVSGPPQNGGLAFSATTGRSHIFFNFEVGTDRRVMGSTVWAMGRAGRCQFFYQSSDF